MKVKPLIVISTYDDLKNPYYAGGGAVSIHTVAKHLANDFRVKVITAKHYKRQDEIIDNVAYKRIGTNIGGPRLGQILFQLYLPFYVIRENFDVWIENFTPPFSTSFLQLFTQKPVIGLVHMLASEDMERKYKLPFHIIEQIGLKTYKYFIVLTKEVKKKILKVNPKASVSVIPNGVYLPRLSINPKRQTHILYVGRIEIDQKGLDLLLQAYKLISKVIPYRLAIAGSGTKREEIKLKEIVKNLELEKKVKFLGRVDGLRKNETFEKAVFVVVPSRYETFSIVSLEAMSYNLPIVCFDLEGLNWIPNNAAIKVKKFDIKKLANAMYKAATKVSLRRKIIKEGEKIISQYTWEQISKLYKKEITKILEGSKIFKTRLILLNEKI